MNDDQLKNWFFSQKKIDEKGCWLWTGVVANHGYGQLSVHGKRYLSHRYSLQLHLKREIPSNMEVRHMCHNPVCFNPEHLKEGTHSDNMNDMVQSNRQARGVYLSNKLRGIEHISSRGENNAKAKLTEAQVIEIKKIGNTRTLKDIGTEYGVNAIQISRILKGITWKHLV